MQKSPQTTARSTSSERAQLTPRNTPATQSPAITVQTPTFSQSGSSRSSSRRTSNALAREPLPTPPPDPRASSNENIFKFPPTKLDYPPAFHSLLDFAEREAYFYKTLNKCIGDDCVRTQADNTSHNEDVHSCACCAQIRAECARFLGPFQQRAATSITATLAAYGAMEQLTRMYSIWDQYLDVENRLLKRKECLKYLNLLEKKANEELEMMKKRNNADSKQHLSDTEVERGHSLSLLDSILSNERATFLKRADSKPCRQRERSKSVMVDDTVSTQNREREAKEQQSRALLFRRQSTYSDCKAKVSKWTKVKAAFKWERANVPAMSDCSKDSLNHVGLLPLNHEVARYLRVPSAPCGAGSSADSILSSSSGHLLSELGGTPGTISSASSMDELEQRGFHNTTRRDSAVSDTAVELNSDCCKSDISAHFIEHPKNICSIPSKSPSNKSMRKTKIVSDFEVLPEGLIADIKSTPTRRTKLPPSPLNLNLKQVQFIR